MPIVFSSLATASVEENTAGTVRNIQASQNAGAVDDGITYTITGGPDAALFNIDAASGALSFIASPDFEAPADSGGDNVYNITVTATGAGPETETQDLVISVTNDAVEQAITGVPDASLDLSSLDGSNGFVINGIDAFDEIGRSVSSAGDVNGDGFDDLIIGASSADPNGNSNAGESYVVFGQASGFGASLDLSSLNGSNGFVINGIDSSDRSGGSVSSAGDVNGDGFDDLIIAAEDAAPNGNNGAGESYVVFGSASGFGASLDLSSLNGSNGFVINGIDSSDRSGVSLAGAGVSSAGDVNGDGFDDLIIGATGADPNSNGAAGESYVVFGRASGFSASLDLADLDGSNGFVINGIDSSDRSGVSVASAGDVNGDGFDDLIIGASFADPNGNDSAGESYVVFGSASGFGASLDLADLDGSNGFVINGIEDGDESGFSVSSTGDVNGDGFDDLIIGAFNADPNGNNSAGESYVVFGRASGFGASLNLSDLDGSNGFVINGIDADDQSGFSVSSAGDVNGDGFDDLIIGAFNAGPNGIGRAGESYVVFGSASGFTASLNLSDLDGSNGFVINGIDGTDLSGRSVSSAGDVNGDGFDDLIIGANGADPNGNSAAGESYVVFGGQTLVANALPTITLPSAPTVNEDDTGVAIADTVQIADTDDDNQSVTLTITGGTTSLTTTGLTFTTGDGTDDASMVFSGSLADVNTALDSLTFTPTADLNGTNAGSIRIQTSDGNGGTADETIQFDIGAVNDAPTGSDGTETVTEDTSFTFSATDFGFSDVDTGDTLTSVRIDTLPSDSVGTLQLSGSNVAAGDTIAVADIPNLTFEPVSNVNGTGVTSFTFSVNDGTTFDATPNTITIDVTAVNDAPTATDGTASIDTNGDYTFAASDFSFADVDTGDSFASVRIDTLTLDNGTLQLNNSNVTAGQVIALADIPNLVYTPSGTGGDSFTFSVNDGTTFAASPNTFTVRVSQGNRAPNSLNLSGGTVAENVEGAIVGTLSATDPDGDTITFSVLDSRFAVEGSTLRLADDVSLDFETEPTVSVGVRASAAGGTFARTFTITVTDVEEVVTQTGGDNDDTLTGGNEDDSVDGGGGNDNISTSGGRDTIDGGLGNDTIDGGNDNDSITGGEGDDEVVGNSGQDTLRGGAGNDAVNGGDDDDEIYSGNDDFGDDTVGGDAGNDTVGGGRGNDSVNGGEGDDVLFGGRGDGADNDDTLLGGEGADTLYGGSGDDSVDGGGGDDQIWAGEGNDDLSGGAGADTFVFGDMSGNDTVLDFDASADTIDLTFASTDFTSFAEVQAAASDTTQGGQSGVLVDLGDGDSVFIIGISVNDLSTDNVAF